MPDVQKQESSGQPTSPQGEDSQAKTDDYSERFARLENENQVLRQQAQRGLEEAAGARAQVQMILDEVQRATTQTPQDHVKAAQTMRDRFDQDPVAAMNDLVTMRIGPVVQEYFGRTADTEREAARQKHGDLFSKYEKEIDVFMKDMPLDVKAKQGSYSAALNFVRSQHLEDEVEAARKQEREKIAQPEGASPAESEKRERKSLSRDEREVMKLGFKDMTEDDWHKYSTAGGERPKKASKKVA